MKAYTLLALSALPAAIVAPATAQTNRQVTATNYVEAQVAILKGAAELLTLDGIAETPAEVANGIGQLAQITASLAALKNSINPEELATAEAEARNNPETHLAGQAFIAAVTQASDKNFYNCEQLAAAVQALSAALEQL